MKIKTTKDYIIEGEIINKNSKIEIVEDKFEEMAIPCSPIKNGGKYPMWIKIPYSKEEHPPAHAHLYPSGKKPSITKFKISETPPQNLSDFEVMPKCNAMPKYYGELIIEWAKDSQNNINNWERLKSDWKDFMDAYEAGLFD